MGQTRHRQRMRRKRQTRRIRQRHSIRRHKPRHKQQGGAYDKDTLKALLQAAPNFGESLNMYESMEDPHINFNYPQYAEITRIGQNEEEIVTKQILVIISASPYDAPEPEDDNEKRDLIVIIISAENDTYISAVIIPIRRMVAGGENPNSNPSRLLRGIREHIVEINGGGDVETATVRLITQLPALRPVYDTVLDALNELYRQPGAANGVRET